jgi:hypothetical protein
MGQLKELAIEVEMLRAQGYGVEDIAELLGVGVVLVMEVMDSMELE